MKNKIRIIETAFIFLFSNYFCQTNTSYMLPESKATWVFAFQYEFPQYVQNEVYYAYYIKGDTIINNKVYKSIGVKAYPGYQCCGSCPSPTQTPSRVIYYRNDHTNQKLYGVIEGDTTEYLLFDFQSQKGDTIKNVLSSKYGNNCGAGNVLNIPFCDAGSTFGMGFMCPATIYFTLVDIIIDSVYYDNTYSTIPLKTWIFRPVQSNYYYTANYGQVGVWMDKIGNLERIFWNGATFSNGFNNNILRCVSINDTIVYGYAKGNSTGKCDSIWAVGIKETNASINHVSVYYNTLTQKIEIKNLDEKKKYSIQVFTIDGKWIYSEQLNGKKEHVLSAFYLDTGIYFVYLNTNDEQTTKKIFIYEK